MIYAHLEGLIYIKLIFYSGESSTCVVPELFEPSMVIFVDGSDYVHCITDPAIKHGLEYLPVGFPIHFITTQYPIGMYLSSLCL